MTPGLEKLGDKVKEIKQLYKGESIVLGNFNIDYNNSNVRATQKLCETFAEQGLNQVIDSITRKTARHETMIDLIFTDLRFTSKSGVVEMSLSDHYLFL